MARFEELGLVISREDYKILGNGFRPRDEVMILDFDPKSVITVPNQKMFSWHLLESVP